MVGIVSISPVTSPAYITPSQPVNEAPWNCASILASSRTGDFGVKNGYRMGALRCSARALAEVGLPTTEISLALFSFNVGIELGQLAFGTVLLVAAALLQGTRRLATMGEGRTGLRNRAEDEKNKNIFGAANASGCYRLLAHAAK